MVVYEVIGKRNVVVPTHAYKVLFVHSTNGVRKKAFVLPNEEIPGKPNLKTFKKTVEDVQTVAGVLFHSLLPIP